MKGKVMLVLLMALCANECNGSAIPMWEFLSRDEKVRTSKSAKKLKSYSVFITTS